MKKYANAVKEKSGSQEKTDFSLMGAVFKSGGALSAIGTYKKPNGATFNADTIANVQSGQQHLSQGVVAGCRNTLSHEEIDDLKKSDLFSEKDCLDLLSLLSHLFKRLDNSIYVDNNEQKAN